MDAKWQGVDAWWRAANYLTVGQIYLQDNPLLREPLRPEHIKPRLLGHWGTSPGLNLLYAHANRLIKARNTEMIFLAGPGHGGPAVLANVYLEGTYSAVYPQVSQNATGMRALFRQFSTPGGVPSHVGPPTPGSIHEGGELGYVLSHAFGAVFDNPNLVALAVVGDGEAETAPLEGSWKGVRFLNPRHDGAVLPVLHLNGYKIANPTVLARIDRESLLALFYGHGYDAHVVEGEDPGQVHAALAEAMERCLDRIASIQAEARGTARGFKAPRWPMIILRTPKGWTGPDKVDGVQVAGTFRAHQVPLAGVRTHPAHLQQLQLWLRSYRPEDLFDESGRLRVEIADQAPPRARCMSAHPATHGAATRPLELPDVEFYAVQLGQGPGTRLEESTRALGRMLRDTYAKNPQSFRLFCPDEVRSNRLDAVFEAQDRMLMTAPQPEDDHVTPNGRVMEVLSEHNCEGWLEGYVLTGRHGLFATYEAFAMVAASMTTQHAKWLESSAALPWRKPIPSLNFLLTSTCWRNDHNGFSHQGPGFLDTLLSKKGTVCRVYLPPDANCLLWVAHHCLASRDHVNLLIIDKQPQLQWLDLAAAAAHCARGASIWDWAGQGNPQDPDVVLACAGDIVTQETVAAAAWLRVHAPQLAVRVVNVVDLMKIPMPDQHPHGLTQDAFDALFTADQSVVFAFHGYPGALHGLLHGRSQVQRFHVRGYIEEGSTTTPFDMVVRNKISRFHLAMLALRHARRPVENAAALVANCEAQLQAHTCYVHEHFEDMPEIASWKLG